MDIKTIWGIKGTMETIRLSLIPRLEADTLLGCGKTPATVESYKLGCGKTPNSIEGYTLGCRHVEGQIIAAHISFSTP